VGNLRWRRLPPCQRGQHPLRQRAIVRPSAERLWLARIINREQGKLVWWCDGFQWRLCEQNRELRHDGDSVQRAVQCQCLSVPVRTTLLSPTRRKVLGLTVPDRSHFPRRFGIIRTFLRLWKRHASEKRGSPFYPWITLLASSLIACSTNGRSL
jgi:hypothetical protein